MTPKVKKKKRKKDIEEIALEKVGRFLRHKGWYLAVAGFENIEQIDKFRYRLSIKFVGRKL